METFSPQGARPPVVWPYAMGAVSMVIGGFDLLRLVALLLQFAVALATGQAGRVWSLLSLPGLGWQGVHFASEAVRPLLGGLLLAAGYTLYKHSRFAPLLHWIYAVPAVLFGVAFPIFYILTCPPQLRQHAMFWPIWQSTTWLVYPVFVIVWFRRPKVRRQVRHWR